jgi:pyridoxine 5-phosphate synthase
MTQLSVNLNKFALIRNARGNNMPDILDIAQKCVAYGANGITVHPRPDERHTRYNDVQQLAQMLRLRSGVEFNVEGNPEPLFMDLVEMTLPDQCTLVPDDPGQLTSDHGWNLTVAGELVTPAIRTLQKHGIRVSLFVDPVVEQIRCARDLGAERVELYTEAYARAYNTPDRDRVLERYIDAADAAARFGIGLNAGHDLNLDNLGYFLKNVHGVLEVSIGHALVCESFDYGLSDTIHRYKNVIAQVYS